MKICFTIWLLAVAAGCSVNNAAKTESVQNGNAEAPRFTSQTPDKSPPAENENLKTTVVDRAGSKTLTCHDPNEYSLIVVTDPDRQGQKSGTEPQILKVSAHDELKAAIKIPTDSDAMGFSLDSTEKTEKGFEITIEYGSRYYYRKQFNFICKEGHFYLYKVKVESFDKGDPESMNKWDRKEIKLNPNLPIEKFSIFDYLAN